MDEAVVDEEVDEALIAADEGVVGLGVEAVDGGDDESCHARPVVAHRSPHQPTAKEVDQHNLTHMVYRSWCPACVASRRPNTRHTQQDQERTLPLLVGDYAFIRIPVTQIS